MLLMPETSYRRLTLTKQRRQGEEDKDVGFNIGGKKKRRKVFVPGPSPNL